jgi:hypothetical protein
MPGLALSQWGGGLRIIALQMENPSMPLSWFAIF